MIIFWPKPDIFRPKMQEISKVYVYGCVSERLCFHARVHTESEEKRTLSIEFNACQLTSCRCVFMLHFYDAIHLVLARNNNALQRVY